MKRCFSLKVFLFDKKNKINPLNKLFVLNFTVNQLSKVLEVSEFIKLGDHYVLHILSA